MKKYIFLIMMLTLFISSCTINKPKTVTNNEEEKLIEIDRYVLI